MNITRLAAAAIVLLVSSGCCSQHKSCDRPRSCRDTKGNRLEFGASISGLAAKHDSKRIGQFGAFAMVTVDGDELSIPVLPGERIRTETAVRIKAERTAIDTNGVKREEDYTLLLGAAFNPGVGEGEFTKSSGVFHVYAGWAVFWGQCPSARTTLASVAAEGTTIAIQILEHGAKNRVYLLKNKSGKPVHVKSSAGHRDMTVVDHYLDVNSNGAFDGPHPISANAEAIQFVEDVTPIALGAGWIE